MNNQIFYLGSFSGKQGGVTVKNNILFEELNRRMPIKKVDLASVKKIKIKSCLLLLKALFRKNNILIIGVAARARKAISLILYYTNRKVMKRSNLIVMGGVFHEIVRKSKNYQKWVKEYDRIFVETDKMVKELNRLGINNVSIFPNCRKKPQTDMQIRENNSSLKCVYFSMIYPEKGVDIILQTAEKCSEISFDFWGDIKEDYKCIFMNQVNQLPNCNYRGIFKTNESNVYEMLNHYDLILLLTRCSTEGIPGAIVEAKIAGVPAILSNFSNSNVLVDNKVNGIILDDNSSACLTENLKYLANNKGLLTNMKEKAKESASAFYFDRYIEEIVSRIENNIK